MKLRLVDLAAVSVMNTLAGTIMLLMGRYITGAVIAVSAVILGLRVRQLYGQAKRLRDTMDDDAQHAQQNEDGS